MKRSQTLPCSVIALLSFFSQMSSKLDQIDLSHKNAQNPLYSLPSCTGCFDQNSLVTNFLDCELRIEPGVVGL